MPGLDLVEQEIAWLKRRIRVAGTQASRARCPEARSAWENRAHAYSETLKRLVSVLETLSEEENHAETQ